MSRMADALSRMQDATESDAPPSPKPYGGAPYDGRKADASGKWTVLVGRREPGRWAFGFSNRNDAFAYVRAAKAAGWAAQMTGQAG